MSKYFIIFFITGITSIAFAQDFSFKPPPSPPPSTSATPNTSGITVLSPSQFRSKVSALSKGKPQDESSALENNSPSAAIPATPAPQAPEQIAAPTLPNPAQPTPTVVGTPPPAATPSYDLQPSTERGQIYTGFQGGSAPATAKPTNNPKSPGWNIKY